MYLSRITDKPDRFSCSQKIRFKRDPPVHAMYEIAPMNDVAKMSVHTRRRRCQEHLRRCPSPITYTELATWPKQSKMAYQKNLAVRTYVVKENCGPLHNVDSQCSIISKCP